MDRPQRSFTEDVFSALRASAWSRATWFTFSCTIGYGLIQVIDIMAIVMLGAGGVMAMSSSGSSLSSFLGFGMLSSVAWLLSFALSVVLVLRIFDVSSVVFQRSAAGATSVDVGKPSPEEQFEMRPSRGAIAVAVLWFWCMGFVVSWLGSIFEGDLFIMIRLGACGLVLAIGALLPAAVLRAHKHQAKRMGFSLIASAKYSMRHRAYLPLMVFGAMFAGVHFYFESLVSLARIAMVGGSIASPFASPSAGFLAGVAFGDMIVFGVEVVVVLSLAYATGWYARHYSHTID